MDPQELAEYLRKAQEALEANPDDREYIEGMLHERTGYRNIASLERALRVRSTERDVGDRVKHTAGTAAGAVATGVSGLVDLPANAINAGSWLLAKAIGGLPGVDEPERASVPTITPWVRDQFPQPESTLGRVGATALSGAVGGGAFGLISKLGAGAAAMQAAGGAVGGGTSEAAMAVGVNPLVAAGIGAVAGGVTSSQGTRLLGQMDDATRQLVDDAERVGVPLRAGDVKPLSSTVRGLEDDLQVGAGNRMSHVMEQQAKEMSTAMQNMVDELAPAAMASDAADDFVANQLRANYQKAKASVRPLFEQAEELAGDAPVPVPQAVQRIDDIMPGVQRARPGSDLARIMGQLKDEASELTYRELREYQGLVGAELASLRTTPGANERLKGAAETIYAAIQRDADDWARGSGQAGVAHNTAMEAFKRDVVPFRQDPAIYRVARSSSADIDLAAERFVPKTLGLGGEGNPRRTEQLMSLLDDDGKNAVAYRVMANASDRATQALTNDFAPGAAARAMNLGNPARPHATRVALRAAGREGDADRLTRVLDATQRSTGAKQRPMTGVRRFRSPYASSALGAGGVAAGGAMGGPVGAVVGGLAGASLTPAVANLSTAAITNPYMKALLMANPGSPYGGILGGYLAAAQNR